MFSTYGKVPATCRSGMGQSALCGLAYFCRRRKIVCAALNQFLDRFIHSKKFFQNIFQKLSGLHP